MDGLGDGTWKTILSTKTRNSEVGTDLWWLIVRLSSHLNLGGKHSIGKAKQTLKKKHSKNRS